MQRRLAAIVCADVAGYSRMMGADEAGTHAAFKAHRTAIYPIILNHGGRMVKKTGDGFLLEFPSVVGAIEAAIEMQRLMAERNAQLPADRVMRFRMGGHMGDEQVTVKKLRVEKIDAERNLLLIRGAVPGARNAVLLVRKAK